MGKLRYVARLGCLRGPVVCADGRAVCRSLARYSQGDSGSSGGGGGGGASRGPSATSTIKTVEQMQGTLANLEKRERLLQKKAQMEVQKAKEYTRSKNKSAALACLKRKKMYEQQANNLANNQLRIHEQMILLENTKATTETVDALRAGASQMTAMQKATNIDDVDKVMDEINEATDMQRAVQDALGTPVGMAADLDEDDLLNELEELEAEDLDDQMMAGVSAPTPSEKMAGAAAAEAAPAMPSVPTTAPAAPATATDEDAELAALEAEMAL